jgi:dienelactone hydrolase
VQELGLIPGVRWLLWQKLEGLAMAVSRDRRGDPPADESHFEAYRKIHSYRKTDLSPISTPVESSDLWKREDVTLQAAYGSERLLAHLFLPKSGRPPYSVVALFEGVEILSAPNIETLGTAHFEFIIRSGRAVIVPAYKGTLERGPSAYYHRAGQVERWRQMNLQWSKDLGRSLDYLETRPDIDIAKVAYLGLSLGAAMGPRLVAVEPRFRTAVLVSGGSFEKVPAEVDSWNFAPYLRIPILMVNGRDDGNFPLNSSQTPLFERIGTPAPKKRHVVLEGGHIMPGERGSLDRTILQWLDDTLGPIKAE